jgi:hypothetical protein
MPIAALEPVEREVCGAGVVIGTGFEDEAVAGSVEDVGGDEGVEEESRDVEEKVDLSDDELVVGIEEVLDAPVEEDVIEDVVELVGGIEDVLGGCLVDDVLADGGFVEELGALLVLGIDDVLDEGAPPSSWNWGE